MRRLPPCPSVYANRFRSVFSSRTKAPFVDAGLLHGLAVRVAGPP
ncbi:hypothetical protein OHA98_36415 [Streptomyces sp. NBC_00654]|nr:hypothetical protein [Streptomyces sp. NBC_00654]MCX4970147.1 hypothetical protein [Streptomyces sp. NBC_00654]